MTNDEFLALEDGATVIFNGNHETFYSLKPGLVLTRKKHWMDDSETVRFDYGTGASDFHFFSVNEIKE